MRYLRMLTNSLIGGGLGAACITILVLQLNPSVPLTPAVIAPLALAFVLSYGVHFAAVIYASIVLRQLLASEVMSPGWLSFRLLTWICTAVTAVTATLMWLNLRGYETALDQEAARRMAAGAVSVTACALVFFGIGLVHFSFGRRGSRVGATLIVLTAVASLSLPLVARGPGVMAPPARPPADGPPADFSAGESPRRLVMIVLDGASLEFISFRAAEGNLPNFGRILDSGAAMHLATLRPTRPAPVWSAAATGKWPPKNGVRSGARYRPWGGTASIDLLPDHSLSDALVRFGFVLEEQCDSTALIARTVWSILSAAGISVGVVGWPLTYPADPVLGYVVSDKLPGRGRSALELEDTSLVHPPDMMPVLMSVADLAPAVQPTYPDRPAAPVAFLDEPAPCQADRLFGQAAAVLQERMPAGFSVVRYQCLDEASRRYLRYAMPRGFGDVPEEERRRLGHLLDAYYNKVDGEVGAAIGALAPGDLLLVVSGFGVDPVGPAARLLNRAIGNPELSGPHLRAPDGFLLAYGTTVLPGRRPRAAIVDVAPTILYFFGLPVGRDMDGYARTDLFSKALTSERPISFIPTYDR
jgi:hypothetical protein